MTTPTGPTPQPVTPQVDDTAADTGSLVEMGWVPEQPVPSTEPFLEPDWPPDDTP